MQIFCDESGGADPANELFLVAAVVLPPAGAKRLLKSFCKAVRWKGAEVKGHSLAPGQRRVFFDLLNREAELGSVVVSCGRRDPLGGWAMAALAESELYGHLLREACSGLAGAGAGPLTITPDGGRYKRAELSAIAAGLAEAVQAGAEAQRKVRVGFGDSASLPGLQVADVVANTVFQALGGTAAAEVASALLEPLRSSGRLSLRLVELAGCRPAWLEAARNVEKPPEGGFWESVGVSS